MPNITMIDAANDDAIAAWLHDRLGGALERAGGEIAITVPGGSTPFPILAELAQTGLDWKRRGTGGLDFKRIAVWPGDDRIVDESHPASNVGRIRALLEPVGARIVPLREGAMPPHFSLSWLGMGGDGHIASLFPNTDPRADDPLLLRRLTPDPLPPEAPFERLSLTIPALLNSDELLFVIRGPEKRAVFDAAARGANDLPIARLLGAAHQPVTCFN
jgi:6-phosphogluconolactonase